MHHREAVVGNHDLTRIAWIDRGEDERKIAVVQFARIEEVRDGHLDKR